MAVSPDARIHPTALVEDGATIAAGCTVGPFCIVGPEVTLHEGVTLKSHVVVTGWTEIGANTTVWQFASLGEVPQDLKYAGERTRTEIGARCRIREGVTVNAGTAHGGGLTRVGDNCLLMGTVHIGHDCQIGNGVILGNCTGIAGHVRIEDEVIIGGLAGVHQWVRIGRGAMIGGMSRVTHDVLPYGLVAGQDATLEGLNLIGLKRRNLDRAEISAMRATYKALAEGEGSFAERARALRDAASAPQVIEMLDFILAGSDRQFLVPR